jgi:cytochrome subunit of sulfide dehydrogenase
MVSPTIICRRQPTGRRFLAGVATRIYLTAVLVAATVPATAQVGTPAGAAACSGCHGAGGAPATLRGEAPDGIVAAMQAFRIGERPATVMDRIAKGFTEEESRAIANWLGKQGRR